MLTPDRSFPSADPEAEWSRYDGRKDFVPNQRGQKKVKVQGGPRNPRPLAYNEVGFRATATAPPGNTDTEPRFMPLRSSAGPRNDCHS
jgi:hypothetical protein